MYNLADIVSTGYQTGAKIGQDITAGNILQEAYKGVDAADPQAAVTINQKAAQLAGMTGNASLAHTFQKEASSLVTDAQKQQLDKTTTQLKQLDLGSRVAKNAKTESDLYGALDTAGLDTNTKMVLRQQISNFKKPDGTFDIEGARKMVVGLGTSEAQDLAAQIKVLQANEKIRHDMAMEGLSLERTRNSAARKDNIKGSPEAPLGAIKRQSATLKDELGDVQVKDASGNLVPMSDAQRATVASRIENEGRQRYKNNPQDYASRQDAVDEARDDIISQDFGTTRTKSTIAGIEVPFTGKDETVYKPKEAAKPAAKKATKGAYSADQTAWIDRAMKANPDMSREEIISEGKKLKKL